jgi:hypothetical protein
MSKQSSHRIVSQRIISTLIMGTALLAPALGQAAHAQTATTSTALVGTVTPTPVQTKNIIDVDVATGTISKGLVLTAGAGNFLTVAVTAKAAPPFLALATTGGGYAVGELVVPGNGYVTVPIYAANGSLASNIRVWDAKTTNKILPPDLVGSAANLAVPATSKGETKPLSAFVLDQLYVATAKTSTTSFRIFDYRTDPNVIKAPDLLGTAANLSQPVTSNGVERPLALWVYDVIGAPPVGVALATSFPKSVGLLPPGGSSPTTVPGPGVVTTALSSQPAPPLVPGSAQGAPVGPGTPVGPVIVPTPPGVLNPAPTAPITPTAPSAGSIMTKPPASSPILSAAQPANTPTVPGQKVVPSPALGATPEQLASVSTTKVCIKFVTKKVKVGKKFVSQKVCAKYRSKS